VVAFDSTERGADVTQQVKHFGTSGEIGKLINDVNEWLKAGEGKIEIVAISESQGGRIGDEADPFYFSLNVVYKTQEADA
jgi:hypothetical protein